MVVSESKKSVSESKIVVLDFEMPVSESKSAILDSEMVVSASSNHFGLKKVIKGHVSLGSNLLRV